MVPLKGATLSSFWQPFQTCSRTRRDTQLNCNFRERRFAGIRRFADDKPTSEDQSEAWRAWIIS